MSAEIEVDTASISDLEFDITCSCSWGKEECSNKALFIGVCFSHTSHKYEDRFLCRKCLERAIKTSGNTFCGTCNKHETVKEFRII